MKGKPVNRKRVMLVAGAVGAVALVLPMAACTSSKQQSSGSGETSNGATAPTSEAAATTVTAPQKASKNYNIQFLQGVIGDQFYITMQCGAQEEAAKLGVKVNTQGPQKFDPTLQKPIVDSVVASNPDAILIAPTDITDRRGMPRRGIDESMSERTAAGTEASSGRHASSRRGYRRFRHGR